MSRKCGRCKLESDFKEAFQWSPSRRKNLCPVCMEKQAEADTRVGILAIVLFLAVGYAATFAPALTLGWLILNITMGFAWVYPLTIVHELGHAIAGRLTGLRVFAIHVGIGRALFKFRLFGAKVEFGRVTAGGFVVCGARTTRWYRLRVFLMYLGGPAANALLAGAVLLAIPWNAIWPSPRLEDQPNFAFGWLPHEVLVAAPILAASIFLLLVTLIPFRASLGGMRLDNDALGMLKLPFLSRAHIQEQHAHYFVWEANATMDQDDIAGAAEWVERGLALYPDNLSLLLHSSYIQFVQEEFNEARSGWLQMLERAESDMNMKLFIYNNVAIATCFVAETPEMVSAPHTRNELIEQANQFSQEAFRLAPWVKEFRGTRAAVLIVSGKAEVGIDMLRELIPQYQEKNRAFAHMLIALGEFQMGRVEEAKKSLALARSCDPTCQGLQIITDRIEGCAAVGQDSNPVTIA